MRCTIPRVALRAALDTAKLALRDAKPETVALRVEGGHLTIEGRGPFARATIRIPVLSSAIQSNGALVLDLAELRAATVKGGAGLVTIDVAPRPEGGSTASVTGIHPKKGATTPVVLRSRRPSDPPAREPGTEGADLVMPGPVLARLVNAVRHAVPGKDNVHTHGIRIAVGGRKKQKASQAVDASLLLAKDECAATTTDGARLAHAVCKYSPFKSHIPKRPTAIDVPVLLISLMERAGAFDLPQVTIADAGPWVHVLGETDERIAVTLSCWRDTDRPFPFLGNVLTPRSPRRSIVFEAPKWQEALAAVSDAVSRKEHTVVLRVPAAIEDGAPIVVDATFRARRTDPTLESGVVVEVATMPASWASTEKVRMGFNYVYLAELLECFGDRVVTMGIGRESEGVYATDSDGSMMTVHALMPLAVTPQDEIEEDRPEPPPEPTPEPTPEPSQEPEGQSVPEQQPEPQPDEAPTEQPEEPDESEGDEEGEADEPTKQEEPEPAEQPSSEADGGEGDTESGGAPSDASPAPADDAGDGGGDPCDGEPSAPGTPVPSEDGEGEPVGVIVGVGEDEPAHVHAIVDRIVRQVDAQFVVIAEGHEEAAGYGATFKEAAGAVARNLSLEDDESTSYAVAAGRLQHNHAAHPQRVGS